METSSNTSKGGRRFFAFLTASATLAIATLVSASSSLQVEQLDSLVVPRTGHAATALSDGRVLITGGRDNTGNIVAVSEIFDPETETSTASATLTTARVDHTATHLADGRVLVAGGNTDSMEVFTPSDQKFTLEAATMSAARTGHWALELSDTRLLFFEGDTRNTIDEFNPATDTLTPKGNLDTHASSATLLVNGKILVLGSDVAGLYDANAVPPAPPFTAFDETSVPGSSTLLRNGQSATQLSGDKRIFVAGGVNTDNLLMGQALFNPARIWTDKDDYQPDEPVILSGSGWKSSEEIYLYAVDNETEQWTYETTITADANGEFVVDPYFIVELRHLGVQFHVTALGAQSAMQADVYFTDNLAAFLYEDAGQTIKRNAFAWGTTVYLGASFNGGSQNKCYRVDWVNPSSTVVQTSQFAPNATLQDSFFVPSSGPSGIWQVNLYEANGNGTIPCSGATFPSTPTMTLSFDVARAVIIGALADNYVDLKTPNTVQNAAGTTLIVGKKSVVPAAF